MQVREPPPGRVPRPGRIRDCRPPRLRGRGEPPRARGRARVVARRPPRPGVEVEVGQEAAPWGASARAPLADTPVSPRPQYGNPDQASLSGPVSADTSDNKSRRCFPAACLPGLHRIPSVAPARPGRGASGAQGVRSIRIAQGTVNKLGGGALRGSARVRAALLHSGRPGSRPTGAPRDRYNSKPAGGVSPPDPRRGEGRHSARRRRQRRRPAARGARRGPARTTKTHHPTAPRAHHRVLAHMHRLAPYRARGAAPISPTSVNWPSPPRAERGSARTDPELRALATKQLTTAGGPTPALAQASTASQTASNETPGRPPRRPPPPAAHQPPPTDSTVIPWRKNAPSQKTYYAHPRRLISTPGLGPAGRWDTVTVNGRPPRHRGIPNLAMTQQLLLGAGEDDRVRSCCVHLVDYPSEAPMLCGRASLSSVEYSPTNQPLSPDGQSVRLLSLPPLLRVLVPCIDE